MDFDHDQQAKCCADERRLDGRKTMRGLPIVDLHLHKGVYRGIVLESGASGLRQRVLFWQRGGKLSKGADHPFDIRRASK